MTGGRLIARVDILYGNTQYYAGDELPNDIPAELGETWIACRSAEYIQEPAEERKQEKPKARPASAPAGRPGIATPSCGPEQDLIGRVPDRYLRGAVKEPSRKAGRKPAG